MSKFYASILKSIIVPFGDLTKGTHLSESYRLIRWLATLNKDQVIEWQNFRMKQLLSHAFNHTTYYRNIFRSSGIIPEDIRTIEDLVLIPVLNKTIIRENFGDLISDNIRKYPFKLSSTGGSTGDPLKYYLDLSSWSMSRALSIFNWEKSGYNYGDKYIALGSTSLFVSKKMSWSHLVYYSLKNKIGLNGINMSDEVCHDYVSIIKNGKIKFVYGYASSIYLLANYVLRNKIDIEIKACFSTSEMLTEKFRATISAALRCKILDCYGASDGGVTAFEHLKDQYEVGYNSLVRINERNESGIGSALTTDLFNFSMPLINYSVGDEIQLLSRDRSYSYNGQILERVIGRSSDIIHLENGRTITGPGFTILFKDLPVENYSIRKSGINSIECKVVKLPEYCQLHEEIIHSTFRKHIGDGFFKIIYVNNIPPAKNGKRQYFTE